MKARGLLVGLGMLLVLAGPGCPADAQGGGWMVESVEALPFDSVMLRNVYPAPDGRHYLTLDSRFLCVADLTLPDESPRCIAVPDDFPPFLETGSPTLRALAWSPDSTRVAIVGPVGLFDGDLWVWDIPTGTLTNLADDGFAGQLHEAPQETTSIAQPAWSPDGTRIAVARSGAAVSAFERLAVLDAASGAVVQAIAAPLEFVIGPDDLTFAPDGRALVISQGFARGEFGNGVWRIDLDTGERRLLASGGVFLDWLNQIGSADYSTQIGPLVWAPDGSRLVAWAGSGGAAQAPQAAFLVDPASGVLEMLLPPGEVLLSSQLIPFEPFQAAWAPDGSALIVAADGAVRSHAGLRVDPDAEASRVTVYVVDAATGIGHIVAELPATNAGNGPVEDYARHAQAAWGPDGHVIIAGYALHLVPAGE